MSEPKHFRAFASVYIKENYRKLGLSVKTAYGGLFGFRRYSSSNPVLVMDHGLMWRALRDLVVGIVTLLRATFGLFVMLTIFFAVPVLMVLRGLAIPAIGVIKALIFKNKVEGAKRAFTKAGT